MDEPIDIPDGAYAGRWTGYTVRWTMPDGREVNAGTDVGVRGINVPCTVEVRDNKVVSVEASDA